MYRTDKIDREVRRRSYYLGSADSDDSGFDPNSLPSEVFFNGDSAKHDFQFAEGKNFFSYEINTDRTDSGELEAAYSEYILTRDSYQTTIYVDLIYYDETL